MFLLLDFYFCSFVIPVLRLDITYLFVLYWHCRTPLSILPWPFLSVCFLQPAGSGFAMQRLSSGRESTRLKRMRIPRLWLLQAGITSRNVRAPPLVTHCFHNNHNGGKLKTMSRHLEQVVMMTPTTIWWGSD